MYVFKGLCEFNICFIWTSYQLQGDLSTVMSTELAYMTIQSISLNVRMMSVPSWKPRFLVDWRLLVKECNTYIG